MTAIPSTEGVHPGAAGLDARPDTAILETLLDSQTEALAAVRPAIGVLATAADAAAAALAGGGRLVYLAAGSPALIALGDALELPQTYGIPDDRVLLICPGGREIAVRLTGATEDDTGAARADVAATKVGVRDCVIGISASGSTPYTVAGLSEAASRGAATVAIAGNRTARLFEPADIRVLLETGPEVIAGSTRMAAGTAQKATLNMLSTLVGVKLGHVHDGLMVNVRADNAKLRARAARIVSRIAGVPPAAAEAALDRAGGAVKPAVLIAVGGNDPDDVQKTLERAGGNLRRALAERPV